MGAIPFEIIFDIVDDGGLQLKVISPLGTETLSAPATVFNGLSHLTDTSACYISFSPWDTKSTMSLDVTAIHTEEEVVEEPDNKPEDSDKIPETEPSDDADLEKPTEKRGFFKAIGDFFRAIANFFKEFFDELFNG